MEDRNPIIFCDLCGGRYRKYFKKKHFDTNIHKEAETKQLLGVNDENSNIIYQKNKQIQKLKEIIFEQHIINKILSK